jgi:hypothetical protein
MAATVRDEDILELSEDPDTDVRMWVACNRMTPERTLEKLAEDPIVFVRRGVAQNRSTSTTHHHHHCSLDVKGLPDLKF